jgi:hypothetical protein
MIVRPHEASLPLFHLSANANQSSKIFRNLKVFNSLMPIDISGIKA